MEEEMLTAVGGRRPMQEGRRRRRDASRVVHATTGIIPTAEFSWKSVNLAFPQFCDTP